MGVKIDLDDFGTGYSYLACLHQSPIDVLKLADHLFPRLEQGGQFAKLVDLLLKLLSETEFKMIAEGGYSGTVVSIAAALRATWARVFFSKSIDAEKVREFVLKRLYQRVGFLQCGMDKFSVFIPKLVFISMIQSI